FPLSEPLTKLTQKEVKFQWTIAYEGRFQELRYKMTSTPVPTLQDGQKGNVMYYYASRISLVYVLKH
ncbi:hypothetical protein MTR67_031618, partial [Solanum verrucosum]